VTSKGAALPKVQIVKVIKTNAKKGALEDKSDSRHPRSLFFQTLRQAVAQADVARGTLNIEKCKN
jgi:hypothetical protein